MKTEQQRARLNKALIGVYLRMNILGEIPSINDVTCLRSKTFVTYRDFVSKLRFSWLFKTQLRNVVCLLYKSWTLLGLFWMFSLQQYTNEAKDILVAGWCGSNIVNVCCSASRTQLRLSSHVPCGPSSCEWYWADVSIKTVPRFFGNKTSW